MPSDRGVSPDFVRISGSPASRRPKGPGVRAGITLAPRRKLRTPSGAVEREFAIAKTPTMLNFLLSFSLPCVKEFKVGLLSPLNRSIHPFNRQHICGNYS